MKIMELNTKEYEELVKKGLVEEEKKIPEKLNIINGAVDGKWENGKSYNYTLSAPQTVIIHKLNEIIDYLESKGE